MQVLLAALGSVALAAGLFAVFTGGGGQIDGSATTASEESELRFFATFWAAYGAFALWLVPRVEKSATAIRGLSIALLAAALARVIAWISAGPPHDWFIFLLTLEVAVSLLLLAGQRRLGGADPNLSGDSRKGEEDRLEG